MAKQKTKPTKKTPAKKTKQVASSSQEISSSQEETNRLLSGSSVERDEDIDVQSQAVASTPKRRAAKKAGEVFDLGLTETSPSAASASTDKVETRKKKAAAAAPAAATTEAPAAAQKKKGVRKTRKYQVLNGEYTKGELEAYDLMTGSKRIFTKNAVLRLIKDIIRETHPDFRVSLAAFNLIHEVLEYEMTETMFIANCLRLTHKKITVQKGDFMLAALIKKMYNPREGFGIHSSYPMARILEAYNVKADIGSENLPLENLGELANNILEAEKSKKKEEYKKLQKVTGKRIRKAVEQASKDTEEEVEEAASEDEEPPAKKAKPAAKKAAVKTKGAKATKATKKGKGKKASEDDEGAQSEQEL